MTTNKDWLFSLPLEEQYAWMNAEHQEPNPDCSAMLYQTFTGNMEHEVEQDSRERLEADAFAYLQTAYITYPQIIELLDRQAAITEREYGERMASEAMCSNVCAVVCEQRGRIAELQVKVDRLTAERERYREKFGKCLDYADAIHALMDDEGMA